MLSYASELLAQLPTMTDQTLGRNIKDRVFAWAFGGGWGWSSGWPGPGQPFQYFLSREDYGRISEESIAESVRDALGEEGRPV